MRTSALKAVFGTLFLIWSGMTLSYQLVPSSSTIAVGDTVTFSIVPEAGDAYIPNFAYIDAISLNIAYDSAVLMPLYATVAELGVDSGLPGASDPFNYFLFDDPGLLGVDFTPSSFPPHAGASSGELAHFTFQALAAGISDVSLSGIGGQDVSGALLCDPALGDSCFIAEDPQDFLITTDYAILADARVEVTAGQGSTIPEPGVLYLLIFGIGGLLTVQHLRRHA